MSGYRFLFILLPLLLSFCGDESSTPPSLPIHYTDVTVAAGIDFTHYNGARGDYYYVETYGSGAGFFDYDDDGWMDIYLVNGSSLSGEIPDPPPVNHLYRNEGDGSFIDVTEQTGTGDAGYGMGLSAADYDSDGDTDLYVANYGPNTLYRNDGDGSFTDVTEQTGTGDERWASSCGFLDYDSDGDLDLFVANYVIYSLDDDIICKKGKIRSYCDPDVYDPIGDILYRNDGDSFTDVTVETGVTLEGRGLGVAFQDYDEDGDTDIYVANDGTMNFLYENRGGSFVEVGLQAGTRYNKNGRAEAGMGVDFGDFDNDGQQDIVVGNFSFETNTLYHNLGHGQFVDASDRLGIGEVSYMPLSFGMKFLDYDNDGHLDIFAANGHVLDNIAEVDSAHSYAQVNQMLHNEDGKRFVDVSETLGSDFVVENVGRSLALADYDNDGDLDLLVSAEADRPYLLRNDGGNQRNWLLIHLTGAVQKDALGARVIVTANGKRQIRQRQSGSSYLATHDPRLHFGLGQTTRADVEIHWPGGQVQKLENVEADQILRVVQPAP